MAKPGPVQLGDKVRDKVTGFTGIATARHDYLSGCVHWSIQPEVDKDGKVPDSQHFNEAHLEVLKRAVIKPLQTEIAPEARRSGPSKVPAGRW